MLGSSSGSYQSSPALTISQMSDPSVVSTMCAPFLQLSADQFCLAVVESGLIPNMKRAVQNGDLEKFHGIPNLVKIMVDNLGESGLALADDLLLTIASSYGEHDRSDKYLTLFLESVSSVPSRHRDDVLVDFINRFSSSPDVSLRLLATNSIALVRSQSRVLEIFKTLASDCASIVRAGAVLALPDSTFDNETVNSIVMNACHDPSQEVRNAAASVIGSVAPDMTEPYESLLRDPETMMNALNSFSAMVEYSGLDPLFLAFTAAAHVYPEKCAMALIECSHIPGVADDGLLFRLAKRLRHVSTLISHLYDFSRHFQRRDEFLKMFRVDRMRKPGERLLYAEQAALFASEFGSKMTGIALDFARDEAVEVREASVKVLVALFLSDPTTAEAISGLARESWEQRLVLARVIGETRVAPAFWDVAKVLSNDTVQAVRVCLANGIAGTEYCGMFFQEMTFPAMARELMA